MAAAHLYSLSLSHPGMCARLALERKRVEFELTNLLPGVHPVAVRALGFSRNTVPALKIDGRRVQGSRQITAYLERTRPQPPLFGDEPEQRARIEQAELWGEQRLQPLPRTLLRYAAVNDPSILPWLAAEVGMPLPNLAAKLNRPVALLMARSSGATEARARAELQQLPETLAQVDDLFDEGTIGTAEPNAADLQILTTLRVLEQFTDLAPLLAERPAMAAARRLVPPMPGPVPAWIPAGWIPDGTSSSSVAARGR